jgi:hypothetical protein
MPAEADFNRNDQETRMGYQHNRVGGHDRASAGAPMVITHPLTSRAVPVGNRIMPEGENVGPLDLVD